MALDLTHAHAARIHADDVVVKARKTALVFDRQLRFERRLPVARDVQVRFTIGYNDALGQVPLL